MAQRERASTLTGSEVNAPSSSSWIPFANKNSSSNSPQSSASSVRSLRKRHSFFGRSSSDASRSRKGSTPQSSISEEDPQQQSTPPRANTSLSTGRRLTEPLQSIRNSFFGGRHKEAIVLSKESAEPTTSPPPSRSGQFSAVPNWSRQHFSTNEDYDRFLSKKTISPPFNFQHVTHTAKTQLPALDTVDEKDLPGEFWSVSAYQRPRKHLNGIKAEDLEKKHREMGIKRGSPSSRPVSPKTIEYHGGTPVIPETLEGIGSLDETMFDEVKETRFDLDDGVRTLEPVKQERNFPKRFSSLNPLTGPDPIEEPHPAPSCSFYESNSSNPSEEIEIEDASPNDALDTFDDIPDFPVPPKGTPELKETDIAYRAKQPLPPLPVQASTKRRSRNPLNSKNATSKANISLVIPVQQSTSPRPKRSSRSTQSTRKSPALTISTALSDTSWEDDVDFCYEQAAESTCDFTWDNISHPNKLGLEKEHDVQRSASPYHACSPTISNASGGTFQFNNTSETIAERRRSRAAARGGHHKHGSSVGHRGFLAARKSSSDLMAMVKANPIPATPSPTQISVISPTFSISNAEERPQKSPFTPSKLHFPGFDGTNTFYLSDPESCRNSGSSKHRKSSSYDSHEIMAKPGADAAKDVNRWSVASANSLPELMHSRPKSKLLISKTIISAPLETLPQSPPAEPTVTMEESTIVPREFQTQPVRNSFLIRRPQTPGDRAVLQAAGKAVQQRGARPTTPSRLSRLIKTPDGLGGPAPPAPEPEWI